MDSLRNGIIVLQQILDFKNSPIVPEYPPPVDESPYDVSDLTRDIGVLNDRIVSETIDLEAAQSERDNLTLEIESQPPPFNLEELLARRDAVDTRIQSINQALVVLRQSRDDLVLQSNAKLAQLEAALVERERVCQEYLANVATREQEVEALYSPKRTSILAQGGPLFSEGIVLSGWTPETIPLDALQACLKSTLQILLATAWLTSVP
jgi:hypothetical protein